MKKSSKKLSTQTVTRLRAVAAAILAEPALYNQWAGEIPKRSATGSCGTPACILGWAVALFMIRTNALHTLKPGARALGMTVPTAKILYVPGYWPRTFYRAYLEARNRSDHFTSACVAVARIEHFIRTHGRE